jgi:branched-chain amino acid transport system ATP-binding protein
VSGERGRAGEPLLSVEELHAGYGQADVVRGVSFTVYPGEAICLIGPNGAGKSTTLRAITGLLKARAGRVVFGGKAVTGWSPGRLAKAGIVHVPEGNRTFARMSVRENIELGALAVGRGLSPETLELAYTLFPILERRSTQAATNLSGGEKKMLAIARGLAAQPRVLVLDEPTAGLAPVVIDEIAERITELNRQGLSMVISEQSLELPDYLAGRTYLISRGETRWEGRAGNLRANHEVLSAVVGEGVEELLPPTSNPQYLKEDDDD